jgi:murein L,D-transpeptidase YafK
LKKFVLGLLILLGALASLALLTLLLAQHNWNPLPKGTVIDRMVVEKSARRLSIFREGQQLKTYRVALGHNPVGAKEQEGDMKTPEGIYQIDYRNPHSDYHLALHVSYPSAEDTARAAERGVPPGFDIMVHGLPNGRGWIGVFHRREDWTAGCVALTDAEIEEIWRVTPDGTTIEIRP